MDDQFMLGAWRRPRPDFVRQVRERLDQQDLELAVTRQPRPLLRAAACAAALLLVVGAFAFPQVRAGAAAFLDLFRAVNFAPVAIQPERLHDLAALNQFDLPHLLGDDLQVLKQSGPPQQVASAEAAGTAAGSRVRMPAWLPAGMTAQSFDVKGGDAFRVTQRAQKLNTLLDTLAIDDPRVPPEADGRVVTVNVPPIVRTRFRDPQSRQVLFMQARQPEASFPAGADLALFAEIGLRVLGIERGEAHRFAQNVDWRSTLLVPVPTNAGTFKQVDVNGNGGLLIEMKRPKVPSRDYRPISQIMWSAGGSVYVLAGDLQPAMLFAMAQSVQ